ncbi:hypothetical protein [Cryobacterium sp. PH31-L1]|uniref:hypothetical protein n=1 Tax=Cryobacterium sp. PH31-L1 TaxID=3046199 RepID=UPI0024BA59FA|nr:hypothetical protein [Cryobacterium sp. PH31-L1]MDJ0376269.1 hypothetical protein [Cryobacterium sp. PH31-L1]
MKRWMIFIGLVDEETERKIPALAIFGSILITLAPVVAFVGNISIGSILVGIASLVIGSGILLFVRMSQSH